MKKSTYVVCTVLLGLLCLISAVTLGILRVLFHWLVVSSENLDNSHSVIYNEWLEPSVPIYLQFYFFNLTNPTEFRNGSKPRVVQRGPYTYREKRVKVHVVANHTDATVRYREIKRYYFMRNLSIGPESDILVTVNLVYLALAQRLDSLPKIVLWVVKLFERSFGEQLHIQRSVSELLWGYEDPLLHFLKSWHIKIPDSRVGLYLDRNNSDGRVDVVVDSGFRDPDRLGTILLYNGSRSVSCWTTDSANQINGTDGSLFHPYLRPDEGIYVFASDLCRSIYFTPRSTTRIQGVTTVEYLPAEDTFDSPLISSKNRGFCIHWPYCTKTGALDLSTCQPGAPIVASMPHFVHADKAYSDAVEGLHPSAEFNTTFYIEPITGAVLSAAKKLQLNANVSRNANFAGLSRVPDVLLPIMYVNESVTVDSDTARLIRQSVYVLPMAISAVAAAVLVLTLWGLCALGLMFLCQRRPRPAGIQASTESDETTPLLAPRQTEA